MEAHAEYLASTRDFRIGDWYAILGGFVIVRGVA
jgi:hypothetical protein